MIRISLLMFLSMILYSCYIYPPNCDQTVVSVCESDNQTSTFITTESNYSRTVSSSKRNSTCKSYTVKENSECRNEY